MVWVDLAVTPWTGVELAPTEEAEGLVTEVVDDAVVCSVTLDDSWQKSPWKLCTHLFGQYINNQWTECTQTTLICYKEKSYKLKTM